MGGSLCRRQGVPVAEEARSTGRGVQRPARSNTGAGPAPAQQGCAKAKAGSKEQVVPRWFWMLCESRRDWCLAVEDEVKRDSTGIDIVACERGKGGRSVDQGLSGQSAASGVSRAPCGRAWVAAGRCRGYSRRMRTSSAPSSVPCSQQIAAYRGCGACRYVLWGGWVISMLQALSQHSARCPCCCWHDAAGQSRLPRRPTKRGLKRRPSQFVSAPPRADPGWQMDVFARRIGRIEDDPCTARGCFRPQGEEAAAASGP